MKELEQMKMLKESIARIEEGPGLAHGASTKFAPGDKVRVRSEATRAYGKWMAKVRYSQEYHRLRAAGVKGREEEGFEGPDWTYGLKSMIPDDIEDFSHEADKVVYTIPTEDQIDQYLNRYGAQQYLGAGVIYVISGHIVTMLEKLLEKAG